MILTRTRIEGVGTYLPDRVLSNEDLARMVDTSDDWIHARTGIRERRIAAEDQVTSDLAAAAAIRALEDAGRTAGEVDVIVLATTTPDKTFPATATAVQAKIGMGEGAAFDVQAVCSGFLFALATADGLLSKGLFRRGLVIGAETFSRIIDWSDRGTCVLFGDGAGAVVVEAGPADADDRGILAHHVRTDGTKGELLHVDGGVSSTGTVGHVRMLGNQVFKHAVTNISAAIEAVLRESGYNANEIDWFVPHQANQRILDGVAKKLAINPERIVSTVARHGNTSAASIPLALGEAIADGRIKRGDLILTEAMGGGFSWGASLFRL